MKQFFIFLILFSLGCKESFNFNSEYYRIENYKGGYTYLLGIDSLGWMQGIGRGPFISYPPDFSIDSVNFCIPCSDCRWPYSGHKDTLIIHLKEGDLSLKPIRKDEISQEIFMENELIDISIQEQKGVERIVNEDFMFQLKVGVKGQDNQHTLSDLVYVINDDQATIEDVNKICDQEENIAEQTALVFYIDKRIQDSLQIKLINLCPNKFVKYQAFFDTTKFDFISYSKLN